MDPGPISSCYAPLRSGWDTLYQEVCWANTLECTTLLGTDIAQTLGKLGLPPTRDAVSAELTHFGIPLAHHLVISGGRRCVYSRVAIYGEAYSDHRVTVLGW